MIFIGFARQGQNIQGQKYSKESQWVIEQGIKFTQHKQNDSRNLTYTHLNIINAYCA